MAVALTLISVIIGRHVVAVARSEQVQYPPADLLCQNTKQRHFDQPAAVPSIASRDRDAP